MEKKKIDRRIQRTRQLLREALMTLILDKGYKKITVQDIIDEANVGRSTFYSHFLDKEDLLASWFEQLADDLSTHVGTAHHEGESHQHLTHSLDFFRHADKNRELYRAMAESGGGEVMLNIGRQHIEKNIQLHLIDLDIQTEQLLVPPAVVTNFLAGTLLSLITWWLEQEAAYTPEEIDEMFNALAMPGVQGLLGMK